MIPKNQSPEKQNVFPVTKVIILLLLITVAGLLAVVFRQTFYIISQKETIEKLTKNLNLSATTQSEQKLTSENERVNSTIFPQFPFITPEGTVRIEEQNTYSFSKNKNFVLILTLNSENILNKDKTQWLPGRLYKYPIQLNESIDSVSNPLIARQHKYGCVTLQSSGFIGSYVFDIKSGIGLFSGPQYSYCVDWIDQDKVVIVENLYDTSIVTYSIFNAKTLKKTELSKYEINPN